MAEPMLLLDTNVVSLMGRKNPPPGLRPWLLRIGIHRLLISYPVLAELMRGAYLRKYDDPEKAARIFAWVDSILEADFPTSEMSPAAASSYAFMTSIPALKHLWTIQKQQRSSRLGHDVMIAALAVAHRLPILTTNPADYLKINSCYPLPGVYHPLEARWHVDPPVPVPLPRFDRELPDPSDRVLPKMDSSDCSDADLTEPHGKIELPAVSG